MFAPAAVLRGLDAPHFAADDRNLFLNSFDEKPVTENPCAENRVRLRTGFAALGVRSCRGTSERCLPVGIIGWPRNPVRDKVHREGGGRPNYRGLRRSVNSVAANSQFRERVEASERHPIELDVDSLRFGTDILRETRRLALGLGFTRQILPYVEPGSLYNLRRPWLSTRRW